MEHTCHPLSPRLDHCPAGLPRGTYLSPDWFTREMAVVFGSQWVCAGRPGGLIPGTMRRVEMGLADVVMCRGDDGAVSAFYNFCRHHGSELCRACTEPPGKLIRRPYHAWAYSADDGRLVATGPAHSTADFDRAAHGLVLVAVRLWNGFVLPNASADPGPIWADVALTTLDNWPMAGLVTGHRWEHEIDCNWKSFRENDSEGLHCPGIHPEFFDMVPVYKAGVMGVTESLGWTPDQPQPASNLKPGARSWTVIGVPCGPDFPGLTPAERGAGHSFVTMGRFNRSSQHPGLGGVDDDGKAKIRTVHAVQIALARTAACLAA